MLNWKTSKIIEDHYKLELRRLNQSLIDYLNGKAFANPEAILSEIRAFMNRPEYNDYINSMTSRIITGLFVDNTRSWREAARRSMRGAEIHRLLSTELTGSIGVKVRSIVETNANLVRSFPLHTAQELTQSISEKAFSGMRSENMVAEFAAQYPEVSKTRIALIARTETSKATTALTRARSSELGLDWYIWKTSEDQRVRASHKHMAEVLVKWKDPPDPEALIGLSSYGHYQAGDIFNCRCYPAPVIHIGDVNFPHKVYYSGVIKTLTLAQFRRLSGIEEMQNAA